MKYLLFLFFVSTIHLFSMDRDIEEKAVEVVKIQKSPKITKGAFKKIDASDECKGCIQEITINGYPTYPIQYQLFDERKNILAVVQLHKERTFLHKEQNEVIQLDKGQNNEWLWFRACNDTNLNMIRTLLIAWRPELESSIDDFEPLSSYLEKLKDK